MPTYQYRCTKCNHEFEEFQGITEPPITFCPKCKGLTERVISGGAGILFKGSGFYQTDYRSRQYQSEAKKEKAAATSSSTDSKDSKSTGASDKKSTGDKK